MRWIETFDLYLFDLDGLLVDTEKLHFEAYRVLCENHGQNLEWDFQEYIQIAHSSHEGLKNALYPMLREKEETWDHLYQEKKSIYMEILRQGNLELMPGVAQLLKELSTASIKRCVATHSAREQVEMIKTRLPILQTIPVWITREDYDQPKPAPDAYLKAIELLADPGDRIVGFEDSLRGFQALKGTIAEPVLICDPSHPQMASLSKITHYPSFVKALSSKKL